MHCRREHRFSSSTSSVRIPSRSCPIPSRRSCPMPFEFLVLRQDVPETVAGLPFWAIGGPVLAVIALRGLLVRFVARDQRCASNKVLVISGKDGGGECAKCTLGGEAYVWPVIQESAYLGLEPVQIDIPPKDAHSFENIRVAVPSVFMV